MGAISERDVIVLRALYWTPLMGALITPISCCFSSHISISLLTDCFDLAMGPYNSNFN